MDFKVRGRGEGKRGRKGGGGAGGHGTLSRRSRVAKTIIF